MRGKEQPPDVGEKEAPARIVGVSVRFAKLVMNAMIQGPSVDITLARNCEQ